MKKIILLLALLLFIQVVSAQLVYEITLSENEGVLTLEQVNVVDLPPHQISGQNIGEYMIVIGNEQTTNQYLDGTFITLPTPTFITTINEQGEIETVEEYEHFGTIHIPYNPNATKLDIYTDDGTRIIRKELYKNKENEQSKDVLNPNKPQDQTENETKTNTSSKTDIQKTTNYETEETKKITKTVTIITVLLILLFVTLILIKYKRRKNEI